MHGVYVAASNPSIKSYEEVFESQVRFDRL